MRGDLPLLMSRYAVRNCNSKAVVVSASARHTVSLLMPRLTLASHGVVSPRLRPEEALAEGGRPPFDATMRHLRNADGACFSSRHPFVTVEELIAPRRLDYCNQFPRCPLSV